jgi:hypothetical protein
MTRTSLDRRPAAPGRIRSHRARAWMLACALLPAWAGAAAAQRDAAVTGLAEIGGEPEPRARVETYPAWEGMPERRFRVTEPLFAERIASLAERSPFVRARLEAIRRSGLRVWVTTPDGLQAIAPGAPRLRAGWATLLNGGRDAVAVVDLAWLRRRRDAGEMTEEQFLADLDLLIGHELFVHIGSIGPGRDATFLCLDPDPVPQAQGCSVVEENLLTYSLDPSRELRPAYRASPLRVDEAADVRLVSALYPELEPDGWLRSPYHAFLRGSAGVSDTTEFQRRVRTLWHRGERARVDGLYTRFMDGILAGRPQAAVEAALLPDVRRGARLTAEDRFRVRELEFVRAGKQARAKEMVAARTALMRGRRPMRLETASARVLRQFAAVPLAPETFAEAVEALYRRGEEDRVREVYARYLTALAMGDDEADVRERLRRELL